MPEPYDPDDIAQRWTAAIDGMESAGLSIDGGVLVAPGDDVLDPSLDPDVVAALRASIDAINGQVAEGELALADVGIEDDGNGQAVASYVAVDALTDNATGWTPEGGNQEEPHA